MSTDKLCRRMRNDIRAMFKRTAEIGRGEGVIYDQRQARLMSNIGNRPDIQDITAWIANRLAIEGTCTRCDRFAVVLRFSAIDKDSINTPDTQRNIKLCMRTTIETTGGDDLITGT